MARTPEGVVFVPKVLPGELVDAEIVLKKKDYANAELTEVLEPSPNRSAPTCANFETVGCCDWDHITYDAQCEIKTAILRESLSRLGRIEWDQAIERITGPTRAYRLRASFHVTDNRLAFMRERTHQPIAVSSCAALMPELNGFINEANEALQKPGLRNTEEVTAIVSPDTGEVAASFVAGRHRTSWTDLLPQTRVQGLQYRLAPDSFFQPNRYLLEDMTREVTLAADKSGPILDLFCGSGFFSLPLARQASEVIAVDRRSILNGRRNARLNGIANVKFFKSSAWAFLLKARMHPRTILLDPPRTGAGKNVVSRAAALQPSKIVYVSCNPTTLAPEARVILDAGYRMISLKFIDQFPNSHHIETIAAFERIGSRTG